METQKSVVMKLLLNLAPNMAQDHRKEVDTELKVPVVPAEISNNSDTLVGELDSRDQPDLRQDPINRTFVYD